jgi:hypothetical protein
MSITLHGLGILSAISWSRQFFLLGLSFKIGYWLPQNGQRKRAHYAVGYGLWTLVIEAWSTTILEPKHTYSIERCRNQLTKPLLYDSPNMEGVSTFEHLMLRGLRPPLAKLAKTTISRRRIVALRHQGLSFLVPSWFCHVTEKKVYLQ